MPSIDNYENKETSKKFKKTAYRPWTVIEGTGETVPDQEQPSKEEKIGLLEKNNKETVNEQLVNDHQTIGGQTGKHQETIHESSENKSLNVYQTIDNPISKQKSPFEQAWSLEESIYHLSRLCGHQRKLLLYVGTKCLSRNDLSSGPVTVRELSDLLATNVDTVKTTAQRLVSKGFLKRDKGKSGNGGFTIFYIQENMKKAILDDMQKISAGLVNNSETKQETRKASISSSYNFTNTTKQPFDQNLLPNEWEQLNIYPLSEIGFTKAHLTQIQKQGILSPEDVQESINAFAFDLSVNGKANKLKGSSLNFFMGILRGGVPYAPAENYESPEVRALRLYLERKKREQEQKEALEKEAFGLAFEDWLQTLSEDDVVDIIPEPKFREEGSPFRRGSLELHFRNNIWANFLRELSV
jgi:predicted transcriptional regulator